ncbi:MAG: hypothetical protein KKB03_00125 [Nanoarchaeota archaeon]|nr:hypothetical protein [Nanoarchaeota archaeon]MBU1135506.1 hypothetical protein [Nanoarchaeota archaeon]MBU2519635.1 hypothetical protein [Nanoarchaeota archaeon]
MNENSIRELELPKITTNTFNNPINYLHSFNDEQLAYWIVCAFKNKRSDPFMISSHDRIGAELGTIFTGDNAKLMNLRERFESILPKILKIFLDEWKAEDHPWYIEDLLVLIDSIDIQDQCCDVLECFIENRLLPIIKFLLKDKDDFNEIINSSDFQQRALLDLCSRCLEVLINSGNTDERLKQFLLELGEFKFFSPLCSVALFKMKP